MIAKILVPSDGSKTAKKVAAYAVDLAKQLKASIIILSVIDLRSLIAQTVSAAETPRHTIEPIEDYLKEAAEGYTEEIKKLCDKNSVASKISIKMGHSVSFSRMLSVSISETRHRMKTNFEQFFSFIKTFCPETPRIGYPSVKDHSKYEFFNVSKTNLFQV